MDQWQAPDRRHGSECGWCAERDPSSSPRQTAWVSLVLHLPEGQSFSLTLSVSRPLSGSSGWLEACERKWTGIPPSLTLSCRGDILTGGERAKPPWLIREIRKGPRDGAGRPDRASLQNEE